jgi:hypothetical protein
LAKGYQCCCGELRACEARVRDTIEGTLAAAFAKHPELSRDAWQAALRSVEQRAYQRGLQEGIADD